MVLPFLAALTPFAPLIGGAVSAIGGMIGGNKPQTTTNYVDYKRMVRDAEAAGFNPLTALRNGGSAGFGVSQSPAMGGSPFGNALQTFGSAIANTDFSGQAQQRERLEIALMQKQLEAANTDLRGIAGLGSFNVPSAAGSRVTGNPTGREEGKVEVTNPWQTLKVHGGAANVEQFEDRYGDVFGGLIGGGYVAWHDLMANLGGPPSLKPRDPKAGGILPMPRWKGPNDRNGYITGGGF